MQAGERRKGRKKVARMRRRVEKRG